MIKQSCNKNIHLLTIYGLSRIRIILRTSIYLTSILFFTLFSSQKSIGQEIDFSTLISRPAPDIDEICTINPTGHNTFFSLIPNQEIEKLVQKSAGTIFEIDFQVDEGNSCGDPFWPQEAANAFRHALDIWAAHIHSDIPIKVSATWREYAAGEDRVTLGGAAPSRVVKLSGVGKPDTWYPIALLSALTGTPIRDQIIFDDGSRLEHDITVNMNCGFPEWYFGIDGQTPRSRVDFVTVVLHEIGHGIGFIGSAEEVPDVSGTARWGAGSPPEPFIYDRFVVDGDYHDLIDETQYPNPSADLFEAITGSRGGIYLEAPEINHTLTTQQAARAVLYSPQEYRRGSSYSHLDQRTFTNTQNALMRPSMDRASAIHTPGPLFCGFLRDIEWPLGEACLTFLSPFASIQAPETEFNFGVTVVGEAVQQAILIENSQIADAPLNITAEMDGAFFTFADPSEKVVQPGSYAALQIQYSPDSEGLHSANLILHHDGKNIPSPLMIELSAEALRPNQLVRLGQSFPNPVVSATSGATISYSLQSESNVRLDLYTIDGRHVQSIVNKRQQSGQYEVNIDLKSLTSGVYIYRIAVGNDVRSKKLMLFR